MKQIWRRVVSIVLTFALVFGLTETSGMVSVVQAAATGELVNGELTANADGWNITGDFADTTATNYGYSFSDSYLSIWTGETGENHQFTISQEVTNMEAGNYYICLASVGNEVSPDNLSVTLESGQSKETTQITTAGWDWATNHKVATDHLAVEAGATVTVTITGSLGASEWYGIKNVELKNADATNITVQKVDGLSEDFINGIDVSTYLSEVESGVKYYDENGIEQPLFKILSDSGVNYIRLRVWNCPFQVDADGNYLYQDAAGTEYSQSQVTKSEKNAGGYMEYWAGETQVYRKGYGAGNCDADTAVEIARQAAVYGINVLVDFHYSDFWADPSRAEAPKAWKNMNLTDKTAALTAYTTETLQKFKDAGVSVGMVQVGNEINNCMAGESDAANVVALVKAGCAAVRAFDANILIAVHYTDPQSEQYQMKKAWALNDAGVDYDVFATSFYPFWHGSTTALTADLKEIADTYNKYVMVAEISYTWTAEDGDGYANVGNPTATDQEYNYPISVEGQATAVRDAIAAVAAVGEKGIGTFYWEGAWVPVNAYDATAADAADVLAANQQAWELYGSGWGSSNVLEYDEYVTDQYNGNTWDNQAFFDFNGNKLESLNVYKYVYTGAKGEVKVTTVDTPSMDMDYQTTPSLPQTVTANFNTGATQQVPVTWNADQVAALATADFGEYTIEGTVDSFSYGEGDDLVNVEAGTYTTTCLVTITGKNYVTNYSFETGDTTDWTILNNLADGAGAPGVEISSSNAKSGLYYMQGWGEQVDYNIEQTIAETLPEGNYELFAYYQGTKVDDSSAASLYAVVTYKDGTTKTYLDDVTINNVWKDWSKSVVKGIEVDSNVVSVKVGSHMAFTGSSTWVVLDDVNLVREGDLTRYTVTFKDGSKTQTQQIAAGQSAVAPAWTKDGYTLSWSTDFSSVKSDITVNAVWTAKSYAVSYVLNGGKNAAANPATYTTDTAVTLKNPTRKGYTFAGWYKDAKFTTKISTIAQGTTSDVKIYAKWTKVTVAKAKTPTLKNVKTRKLAVSWKKVSKAAGYQISYSTSKKFAKSKTKTTTTTSLKKTVKSLKKGKTYYVRVRAYKKDSTGAKVYGKYSTVKKIKITK